MKLANKEKIKKQEKKNKKKTNTNTIITEAYRSAPLLKAIKQCQNRLRLSNPLTHPVR